MRNLYLAGTAAVLLGAAAAAAATSYTSDPQSRLEFVGVQAGAEFKGVFHKFTANVEFAPEALASSRIDVQIDMNSVDSLDKDRDTTIRGKDVFDVAHYPTAHYATKSITKSGAGFSAVGALTLPWRHPGRADRVSVRAWCRGRQAVRQRQTQSLGFRRGPGRLEEHRDRRRCRENQFLLGTEAQGLTCRTALTMSPNASKIL